MNFGEDFYCKYIPYEELRINTVDWIKKEFNIEIDYRLFKSVTMNSNYLVSYIDEHNLNNEELEVILELFDGSTNTDYIWKRYLLDVFNIGPVHVVEDFRGIYIIYE